MTRYTIIALGLFGIAIVARAAYAYLGLDAVALAMCLLMVVVLASGVVELVLSVGQTERLRAELAKVASAGTPEAVDGASVHLRALVRSRLDRVPLAVPQPAFAPYLVGLLVMLGLLGTFLGLFETLRGAHAALTNSGDLEALRAGLAAPMRGLVRSFGTSAAGVAGSAVLGLASVIARRGAQGLASDLAMAVAGPLASQATAARELAAMEALSSQGRALPAAADALDRAATEIARIGAMLPEQQRDALDAIRTRLVESVSGIEKQLVRATDSIEKQLTTSSSSIKTSLESAAIALPAAAIKAIEPHVAKSLEASTAAATKHLDDVRRAVEKDVETRRVSEAKLLDATTKHLGNVERALEATRESMAAAELGRAERVGEVLEARLGTLATTLTLAIESATKPAVDSLESMAASFGPALSAATKPAVDSLESMAASFGPALSAATKPAVDSLESMAASFGPALTAATKPAVDSLESMAASFGPALTAATKPAVDSLESVAASFGPALTAATKPAVDSLESMAASFGPALTAATVPVSAQLTAMAADLATTSESVRENAERASGAVRDDQARIASLFDRLADASTKVGTAAVEQSAAVDRVVSAAEARLEGAERTSEARLSALLERVDALVTAEGERSAALDTLLRESSTRTADEVARLLGSHAQGLSEELAKTQALVHEAAALVHAGGAELESLATAFGESVDRHRNAADEWLANLGKVEAAVIASGETAASDVLGQQLARTHEIFDRQLRFQNELLDRVRGHRDAAGAAELDDVRASEPNEPNVPAGNTHAKKPRVAEAAAAAAAAAAEEAAAEEAAERAEADAMAAASERAEADEEDADVEIDPVDHADSDPIDRAEEPLAADAIDGASGPDADDRGALEDGADTDDESSGDDTDAGA